MSLQPQVRALLRLLLPEPLPPLSPLQVCC
jgi:hypothetical protein